MASYSSLIEFAVAKNIIEIGIEIKQQELVDLIEKKYSFITAQYYTLLIPKEDIEKYQSDNKKTLFIPMDKLTQYDRYITGKEE